MKLADCGSVVAIDATSRGLAFVSFENGRVLDWGERLRRWHGDERRIVDSLLEEFVVNLLVLEDPDAKGCKRHPRIRRLLRTLASHVRGRHVAVAVVSREDVRDGWARRGATNKAAVAAVIASHFGELSSIVPPARRAGANEDPRVNIFYAASLALHYGSCPFAP